MAAKLSIVAKELLPTVLACERWGKQWEGTLVQCLCDNQAVVASLRSRTSKNENCLHMLRVLAFIEARYRFSLRPAYINTKINHQDLSRNNAASFLLKVPEANRTPDTPLARLLELLLEPNLDWVSPHWRRQFEDIFRRDLPLQPNVLMNLQ